MLNDLLLLSKNDIPFIGAQINIHQPTIKEIALIGEDNFFSGCEMLNFSKEILSEQDRINLAKLTNFEILMSIMNDKNSSSHKNRVGAIMVLTLLFPGYEIHVLPREIDICKEDEHHYLNNDNFESFKEILVAMFCLKKPESEYNPGGDLAKRISDKLKKGKERKARDLGEKQKIDVLSRYSSVLSVGMQIDLNTILDYSVYQLFDAYQRYELKVYSDSTFEAKLAGAKDIKDADNWMKDIHSN